MAAVAAASGMLLTAQFPLPSAPIIALILLHVVTHRSDDGTVCVRHQLSQRESNTHTHKQRIFEHACHGPQRGTLFMRIVFPG